MESKEELTRNLLASGFAFRSFKTGEEAATYLDGCIDATDVGFGGSVTLQQIGLYDKLISHNRVFWHWVGENKAEKERNRIASINTEVYVCSVNAITKDGYLVNVDGVGNRTSSMLYGHKRLYFVLGSNKIVKNLDEAILRVRNIAAPMNNRRMKREVPCANENAQCSYCGSPTCTIRGMAVLMSPMMNSTAEVILVDEQLGF